MPRGYFSYFDKTDYMFSENVIKRVTNLAKYTAIFSRIADNSSYYNYYNARPSERLDTISHIVYGSTEYYWTIPILNTDIVNIWTDMGKDLNEFNKILEKRYPGYAVHPITDNIVDVKFSNHIVGKFYENEPGIITNGTNVYPVRILKKYQTENYVQVVPENENDFFLVFEELSGYTLKGLKSEDTTAISHISPLLDTAAYYVDSSRNRITTLTIGKNINPEMMPVTWREIEELDNGMSIKIKLLKKEHVANVVREFKLKMSLGITATTQFNRRFTL